MFRSVVLALALVGASAFTPSVLKTSITRRAAVTRGAMEMRTPIMAGNWKMNPPTVAEAKALAEAVGAVAKGDAVEVRERRLAAATVVTASATTAAAAATLQGSPPYRAAANRSS